LKTEYILRPYFCEENHFMTSS